MKNGFVNIALLSLLSIATVALALSVGSESIAFGDILSVIKDKMTGSTVDHSDPTQIIIWDIRFPRVLLAYFVGGSLACLGVAMQTLVRNPLAEPFILGISSGASAGASLFYLGFLPPFIASMLSLPFAAFLGALFSIWLVFLVAKKDAVIPATRLLLAGIAISSFLGAITSFVTLATPDGNRIQSLLFWLLGSLSSASWGDLVLPGLASLVTVIGLTTFGRPLDAMLLGEDNARSLGINIGLLKKALLLLTAAVTGICVAASGIIGFVGLIIPHFGRMIVGATHRKLVPFSFFAGALFLVIADLTARSLLSPQELPIGVVTAICGVPFFLYILRKKSYTYGGV